MHIAIIGGSSFIGTRLTKRLLASGHKIKILDKQDSKYYPELRAFADVREIDSLNFFTGPIGLAISVGFVLTYLPKYRGKN